MKYLKVLGFAAAAAAALMASAGVGTASATVLCKVTETPCSTANEWPAKTEAVGSLKSGTTALFKNTAGAVEETCNGAKISGTLGKAGSGTETVSGTGGPENVVWSGCTNTMDTIEGGEIEVHHIAGTDNGTVTGKGFKTTVLLFGVSCVYSYGTGTDIGVITGGESPTLHVNMVINKSGGSFLCPTDAIVEAVGVLTEPKGAAGYVEDE
jgi:hypothetical protein